MFPMEIYHLNNDVAEDPPQCYLLQILFSFSEESAWELGYPTSCFTRDRL